MFQLIFFGKRKGAKVFTVRLWLRRKKIKDFQPGVMYIFQQFSIYRR